MELFIEAWIASQTHNPHQSPSSLGHGKNQMTLHQITDHIISFCADIFVQ
jgi:hypothetical protein